MSGPNSPSVFWNLKTIIVSPYSLKVNFLVKSEQLDVRKCTIGCAKVYNWMCKIVQLDVQKWSIGCAKVDNWNHILFVIVLNKID